MPDQMSENGCDILPYVKDTDFIRLAELISVTVDIAKKDQITSIAQLTERALALMRPYLAEDEKKEKKRA